MEKTLTPGGRWLIICVLQTATPGCRLATSFEGQLNLLALVRQGLRIDIAYVETTVRQLLQAEGDLFAFQREVGLDNGILRAVVEYSDTTTALTAFWKYHHGLTVHVGLSFSTALHRPHERSTDARCASRESKLCSPSTGRMALPAGTIPTRASRRLWLHRCASPCKICRQHFGRFLWAQRHRSLLAPWLAPALTLLPMSDFLSTLSLRYIL